MTDTSKYTVSHCPGCGSEQIQKDVAYSYRCESCGVYWEINA